MGVDYPPLFERVEVDGVKVVKDEVCASGLSFHNGKGLVPLHGLRVLTLETDEVIFGCRDCETVGTRGQVIQHRHTEHGVAHGGATKRTLEEAQEAGLTADALPYPPGVALSMTVYDVLVAAQTAGEWEIVFGNQEARIEVLQHQLVEAGQRAKEAESELRKLRRTLRRMLGEES